MLVIMIAFSGLAITSKIIGFTNTRFLTKVRNFTISIAPASQRVNHTKKVTHIGFLKVHKTGSTTTENIFFRFGLKNNLNIAVPARGNYLFKPSDTLRTKYQNFSDFDIFASHTIYSKALFSHLLPEDYIMFGIIREPLDRMISGAYYYRDVWGVGYLKSVPVENFIHNLVNYPEKYERAMFSRTRNSMGKDFGFSSNYTPEDKSAIKQKLDTLNSEFALVMVTERFDESLVLMKRLLHWSFADIMYWQINKYAHKHTALSEEEVSKFKKTSFLDYAIYEYFTKEFERKVIEAGVDLQEEVKYFQKCLVKVKDFCDNVNVTTKTVLEFPESKWDESFGVSKVDCLWMMRMEETFMKHIKGLYLGKHHRTYEQGPQ